MSIITISRLEESISDGTGVFHIGSIQQPKVVVSNKVFGKYLSTLGKILSIKNISLTEALDSSRTGPKVQSLIGGVLISDEGIPKSNIVPVLKESKKMLDSYRLKTLQNIDDV